MRGDVTLEAPTRGALPASRLYGRLLATAVAHAAGAGPAPSCRLRLADGRLQPLPLDLWLGPTTAADEAVVGAAVAPVLDVGCGPGRLLAALESAGKPALGVDLSPVAVGIARRRGGRAVAGSVFAAVPRTGAWRTAVLLDGNIGIGGDPALLLRRVAALLRRGGEAIVEVEPPGVPASVSRVRIEGGGAVSDWFAWARVGADDIGAVAAASGLRERAAFEHGGRWFSRLGKRT